MGTPAWNFTDLYAQTRGGWQVDPDHERAPASRAKRCTSTRSTRTACGRGHLVPCALLIPPKRNTNRPHNFGLSATFERSSKMPTCAPKP